MHSNRANFTSNGGRAVKTVIIPNVGYSHSTVDGVYSDPAVDLRLSQVGTEINSAVGAQKTYNISMTPEEARSFANYLTRVANEADRLVGKKSK